jgi:hypothetical protein
MHDLLTNTRPSVNRLHCMRAHMFRLRFAPPAPLISYSIRATSPVQAHSWKYLVQMPERLWIGMARSPSKRITQNRASFTCIIFIYCICMPCQAGIPSTPGVFGQPRRDLRSRAPRFHGCEPEVGTWQTRTHAFAVPCQARPSSASLGGGKNMCISRIM